MKGAHGIDVIEEKKEGAKRVRGKAKKRRGKRGLKPPLKQDRREARQGRKHLGGRTRYDGVFVTRKPWSRLSQHGKKGTHGSLPPTRKKD